jgi:hypothetical protein
MALSRKPKPDACRKSTFQSQPRVGIDTISTTSFAAAEYFPTFWGISPLLTPCHASISTMWRFFEVAAPGLLLGLRLVEALILAISFVAALCKATTSLAPQIRNPFLAPLDKSSSKRTHVRTRFLATLLHIEPTRSTFLTR